MQIWSVSNFFETWKFCFGNFFTSPISTEMLSSKNWKDNILNKNWRCKKTKFSYFEKNLEIYSFWMKFSILNSIVTAGQMQVSGHLTLLANISPASKSQATWLPPSLKNYDFKKTKENKCKNNFHFVHIFCIFINIIHHSEILSSK